MLGPNLMVGYALGGAILLVPTIIVFLYIRYKQKMGDWKGVQNKLGTVLFMLLFIGLMILQFVLSWR